jgi:hypothetical protein
MKRKSQIILWTSASGLILLGLGVALWVHRFHRYTPVEVVQDLRAGVASRGAPNPVERFLEVRYGPLTEPANRRKAFLDFFNVGHIEGLQLLTRRIAPPRQQASIAAMAAWVADYRRTLPPEEKEILRTYLESKPGQITLQQATAQYLSQDVRYRAATAPVIRELMITLAEIKKP